MHYLTPPREVLAALKGYDPKLDLQFDQRRCRWKVVRWARRHREPDEADEVDREIPYHVMEVSTPGGAYMPPTKGLLMALRLGDTFQVEPRTIWERMEAREEAERQKRDRDLDEELRSRGREEHRLLSHPRWQSEARARELARGMRMAYATEESELARERVIKEREELGKAGP